MTQGSKTLEEIAELFGDTLATEHIGQIDVDAKNVSYGEIEDVEMRDHSIKQAMGSESRM